MMDLIVYFNATISLWQPHSNIFIYTVDQSGLFKYNGQHDCTILLGTS